MEKAEFTKIFGILKNAYPYYFKDMTSEERIEFSEVWYGFFKRDDLRMLVNAIQALVVKSNFMPSIHAIKAEMALCTDPDLQASAMSEWDKVIKAIRYFGIYRENEAMNSFGDTTADVVRCIGWQRICMSSDDDIEWRRKDFCEMYEDKRDSRQSAVMLGGGREDDGQMQALVRKVGG